MPIKIPSAPVRDAVTGEINTALRGEQVQIVLDGTTTPYPIMDAASDLIPDSLVTVQTSDAIPTIYIDPADAADLYLDWYHAGSGARNRIDFDAVSRDAASAAAASSATSAASSLASEAAATATAESVAAFQEWFEAGVTTRNVVVDPRATNATRWGSGGGTGGVINESLVTGATDGPLMPDGTRATTYARYTVATANSGGTPYVNYVPPNPASLGYPAGTPVVVGIYIRPSVTTSWGPRAYGVDTTGAAVWTAPAGAAVAIPAATWVRIGYAQVVATASGDFIVRALTSAILPVGMTIDVTLALAVPGETVLPDHYDGASPSTARVGNRWTGTPNASVSEHIDMSRLVRSVNGMTGDVVLDLGSGGGTSDHNQLSNLTTGDPHTQYLNAARGDQRYYSRGQVDAIAAAAALQTSAADRDRANHTGEQGIGSITGLQAALDAAGGGAAGPDVPRIVIVATGDEPRPADAVVVQWYDGRDPSTPQPVNMGTNDIRILGTFTAGADLIAPSVPTGLTIGSITASGATLTWTASTDNVGVTGYEVRRDGSVSLGVATGLSRAITGLAQNTAHTVAARARDAAGNWSAWSAEVPFTTSASSDTTAPTVPTGLASSAITGSGFTVTWGAGTDNVGVTGYDWRLNGGAPTTVPADPRSLTLSGLAAETAYTVGIRSRDAAGNTSAYVDLVVTTGEADAVTYNVFGASAPPGTYAWDDDATPYILLGQGFRCTAAGARAVGGRMWIPTAAAGMLPTEATFYLFGPNQGIETSPVQTKVVSTAGATAGSWVEALFDTPQAMGDTEVWMIGVRFTGTGDAGKYSFGSGVRGSGSAVPSVGPLGEDLGWIEYGTALNMAFRIGTGSVTPAGSNDQGRGIDIIVDLEG